jgi:hypothetical protein
VTIVPYRIALGRGYHPAVTELVIVVALLAAIVIGVVANRRWTTNHDGEGLDAGDLVNPITTIAAILLAFVMVEALSSYGRARENAGTEARVVDASAEAAARVANAPLALAYEADLVCYARAVRFQEWPSMARSGDRSPVVAVWNGDIERVLGAIRRMGGDDELDRLIDFDAARSDARLSRLAEADPSLPTGLNWLMLGSVVVAIFGLAMFMKPGTGAGTNVAILLIFGAIVGGTLIMVIDLDRPFDGFNKIEPTAMIRTQAAVELDFATRYPSGTYPCDAAGIVSVALP